ncbi:glycoside hydrolase [Sphingomonas sp.]|uniref:glycoside hydrolase n=1 Tax=Sphingomonas sp. TaxID=28214 RepID=UPI0025F2D171|nr:glycoside hydrolase [Sphingomonas sp.]
MTITIFGVLVALIGGILMLRASMLTMLVFVMMTTLLGGSAAFYLSTGSSVLPSIEAVLLLTIRCIMPTHRPNGALRTALDANLPLLLFVIYGVAGALVLPIIFAGAMDVAPLRPVFTPDPFATIPLSFTPQNLTSAGYLFTTMLGAVCAFVAVQSRGAEARVARAGAVVGITHATLGFVGIAATGTPLTAVFDFFRNALYNQVDQEIGGLARMNGIFAEASNFAAYGFVYFVFATEMWLRGIDRRWTGSASLVLVLALVVSTSTTAYVGLAGYAAILLLRKILFPGTIPLTNLVAIMLGVLCAAVAILSLFVVRPESLKIVDLVYRMMVVNKSESESALVRIMWAKQGIEAFWISGGLGVGVGSFRSSSLGTAILGSMGVIGVATFAAQTLRVLKPLKQSTYLRTGDARIDVGAAATWTVVAMSIPSFVSAPSPDPGLNWGLMVGIALGLRRVSGTQHFSGNFEKKELLATG